MGPRSFPYLDADPPIAIAHRGGAGDWPENTMPAFAGAVGLGYRYVETDVHATADGVLVAFHDDELDRVTDRSGVIGDLPWSEVRLARVDGQEPIPLLEDLLGEWPDLRVNIDPKHDEAVDPLIDVLDRTGAIDRVCVGAFSGRRLRRIRGRAGPRLCTSLGPFDTLRLRLGSWWIPVGGFSPPAVQVPPRHLGVPLVDRRFVAEAHARGIAVHVWTINDPAEIGALLDLGVDGIMTDRPAVLKEVLSGRGEWPG